MASPTEGIVGCSLGQPHLQLEPRQAEGSPCSSEAKVLQGEGSPSPIVETRLGGDCFALGKSSFMGCRTGEARLILGGEGARTPAGEAASLVKQASSLRRCWRLLGRSGGGSPPCAQARRPLLST